MIISLIDFGGRPPERAHKDDVGADVFSPSQFTLYPGQIKKVPLGFGLELPTGVAGFIFPRSSLAAKGITCELPPIDPGYKGEVHAIITNNGLDSYDIKEGDRIGQLVLIPVIVPQSGPLAAQSETQRSDGAFGSTGR